ncbi:MAG: AI-2E family transporter [Rhizobiaceae bacterium]|nr:AI-2E family transporter [Rhizobiaceae bacterium]
MNKYEFKKPPIVRLPPRVDIDIVLSRSAYAALILLGVVGLVFALQAGEFILMPVALAVVVGLMLGPVATWLERSGWPSWASAAAVFLLFVTVVCVLALALVGPLSFWAGELPRIWNRLQVHLAELREPLNALRNLQDEMGSIMGGSDTTLRVEEEGAGVEDVAIMAPALVAQVLLFMASLYFFVATRQDIRVAILRVFSNRRLRWRTAHIFRDVEKLVSRYLLSIAAINVGLGIAVTLVLWAIGVPSPALWGALAGLLNFVVYIGPAIMALILLAVGLSMGDTLTQSILPPLAYLGLNLVEAQFVTPMVIGRTMTLNPFLVLLALAFWIWLWGPIGGFIAIPALLIVFAIGRNILPGLNSFQPR